MNKFAVWLSGVATGVALAFALVMAFAPVGAWPAPRALAAGPASPDGGPAWQGGNDDESPRLLDSRAPGAEAAITNSVATLYFAPQDNDANGTVLVVVNTEPMTQTVALNGYGSGTLNYALSVHVGPRSVIHLVSDAVAASPPPSFADSIVTNFTDFTEYATIDVPKGVRVDGYIVFNAGTGTIDPRADQGAIPLRFSADTASLFLPTIMR